MVAHDIIPRNVRLHRIRLMDTDNCTQCGTQSSMLDASQNVGWDRRFGNGPAHGLHGYEGRSRDVYLKNGSFVPFSNCGPDKDTRRSCGFWRIYFFFYLVHQRRTLSAMDNIDFMSRTQCKTYQDINRMKLVGDYVEVSSLRLHLSPLPFLPTVIPFLIRLVFFQLTGMLALLIVW